MSSDISAFHYLMPIRFARAAHAAVQARLRTRFGVLLQQIENATGQELLDVRLAVGELLASPFYTPEIYAVYSSLEEALATRQRDELIRLLQLVLGLPTAAQHRPHPVTRSFGRSEADRVITALVAAHAGAEWGSHSGPRLLPILPAEMLARRKEVESALFRIGRLSPLLLRELKEYVRWITIFKGAGTVGVSSLRVFGAIYIRVAPDSWSSERAHSYYVEHILHEAAHIHLNALLHLDPVILNSPTQVFSSPLRTDPRPMRGVLHATFVLGRLVHIFHRWRQLAKSPFLDDMLASFQLRLREGLEVLMTHGKFTTAGQGLCRSLGNVSNLSSA
jgi:HEXXH motif-containing protein